MLKVAHVRCGYGGLGPAPPSYCAVMPDFDATAVGAVTGLRMTEFVVEDIARAAGPIELRIWLPGRDRDHNEITRPFAGAIAAGQTLRLRGNTPLTPIPPDIDMWQRRYRATLVAEGGLTLELSGVLDSPWATA
jgi:hypothetical protein